MLIKVFFISVQHAPAIPSREIWGPGPWPIVIKALVVYLILCNQETQAWWWKWEPIRERRMGASGTRKHSGRRMELNDQHQDDGPAPNSGQCYSLGSWSVTCSAGDFVKSRKFLVIIVSGFHMMERTPCVVNDRNLVIQDGDVSPHVLRFDPCAKSHKKERKREDQKSKQTRYVAKTCKNIRQKGWKLQSRLNRY
jgi:hypothetical protein